MSIKIFFKTKDEQGKPYEFLNLMISYIKKYLKKLIISFWNLFVENGILNLILPFMVFNLIYLINTVVRQAGAQMYNTGHS